MYKNMGLSLVLVLVLMLTSGVYATMNVSENNYLIGHKIGVVHILVDDQSTDWTSNVHTETYYEGIITDIWYDFVLVKYNNNEFEWVNKASIRKLLDM